VIVKKKTSHLHFSISQTKSFPSPNTIKFWTRQLEGTASTVCGNENGAYKKANISEDVQLVRKLLEGHQDALSGST
jgi:hypothetical protein